ncbi:putative 60 ribosomal protein L14 [Paratrimastix pyriformis]|uniref:60 ribosomal protein L14 n=1 Tax=Paratrimastix pyriformis TaxID=342808 RepID=A0ABQ8UZG2_9EUKA|nr:putative 60 ribosomal protein L14 [Paratrimastix pyriformis]|eukprot:GAFH01003735.1.p3 GENE.GAFH01003735.1~~GAFH01003735.1.p3  ORF type:complete len:124 (+),score=39.83 GAFH01003735.1:442-813(+)
MPFNRFVEIGRVCTLNYGQEFGNLCTIVEVADQNRVVVEGPKVPRQMIPVKRINLTQFTVKIGRNARAKFVLKAMQEAKVQEKFDATVYGKSLVARRAKLQESDFERFQRRMAAKKAHLPKKH